MAEHDRHGSSLLLEPNEGPGLELVEVTLKGLFSRVQAVIAEEVDFDEIRRCERCNPMLGEIRMDVDLTFCVGDVMPGVVYVRATHLHYKHQEHTA